MEKLQIGIKGCSELGFLNCLRSKIIANKTDKSSIRFNNIVPTYFFYFHVILVFKSSICVCKSAIIFKIDTPFNFTSPEASIKKTYSL